MIKYYFIWVLSVLLHEIGHVFVLKLGRIPIERLVLGSFLFLKIRKIWLSPFFLSSYVAFNEKKFDEKSRFFRTVMYLAGPFVNLLLFLVVPRSFFAVKYMNFFLLLLTLLPFSGRSDSIQGIREFRNR